MEEYNASEIVEYLKRERGLVQDKVSAPTRPGRFTPSHIAKLEQRVHGALATEPTEQHVGHITPEHRLTLLTQLIEHSTGG